MIYIFSSLFMFGFHLVLYFYSSYFKSYLVEVSIIIYIIYIILLYHIINFVYICIELALLKLYNSVFLYYKNASKYLH